MIIERSLKMTYMGSKSRITKDIVPIIQGFIDNSGYDIYYEPHVGGERD